MKKEPYTCIRCGYTIEDKSSMNKHLYKTKKQCPATSNDIELTNEIKDYILANRIYKILKEEPKNIIRVVSILNLGHPFF